MPKEKRIETPLTIENAKIIFRNFAGQESKYNPAGSRNFCVLLDEEVAIRLSKDGWNVKYLDPREEGDPPQAYMRVTVKYDGKGRPPKIYMITSRGQTLLTDNTVNVLDFAEIELIDLIIRPYNWEVNGAHGVSGYVGTMYVTIVEDELEKKYNNMFDSRYAQDHEPE